MDLVDILEYIYVTVKGLILFRLTYCILQVFLDVGKDPFKCI